MASRGAPSYVHDLDLQILGQPDDSTCGPTCLHAVYRYFGDRIDLGDLIAAVPRLDTGGTMAVQLANHALRRGYSALIYTYNLGLFDPSWFEGREPDLAERLEAQARAKREPRLQWATLAYLEFLRLGGELEMEDLSAGLLRRWLERERPILTGLSATFLYRCAREIGTEKLQEDDVCGSPTGHFVVLSGWDPEERKVRVADPLADNPRFHAHVYWLPVERVINAILLGVLTYDANLLVLEPPEVVR
jgi:hypothetical protein